MKLYPMRDDFLNEDRQTDRHDEGSSHFSQFCEGTWKGKWIIRTKYDT